MSRELLSGLMTVSQYVKVKGGEFKTNIQGRRVRVEVKLAERSFVGLTTLSIDGIRTVEEIFERYSKTKPAQISPAVCGFQRNYVRSQFEGEDFEECLNSAANYIDDERKKLCSFGFFHDGAEEKIGTYSDLMNDIPFKRYAASNNRERIGMKAVIEDEKLVGTWEGLEFVIASDEVDCGCKCEREIEDLFKNWMEMKYSQLQRTVVKTGDLVVREMEADSIEDQFFKLFDQAITSWPQGDRDAIYWAKGRPTIGKNKSIASALFARTEAKIPFKEFFSLAEKRCLEEWNFEQKNKSMGAESVEKFVLGQMLRNKAQLEVDRGNRTLRYEPTPAAYLEKQKRLE